MSELYIPGETIVPYQCTAGPEEEKTATIIRKIFSGLSVFGSGFIIGTIYQKWRRNPRSIDPYCRIMVGLSIYDIIWSFFPWFMGSWMMPIETGHWGASGNTQTCTMQGFFFWLGVPGAQYYQILLSLHTLLLVTFRWKPQQFHKRIERWSHGFIFGVALILATVPLFFEGYNPECSTCLPAPLPIWCGDWIFWGDGETECLRGSPKLSQAYYTIYLTNLSIMGVFCTGAMIQVYWSVRKQEIRNSRYASFRSDANRDKSRRIRRTMILYTFGFYLCWIVPSFIIHFAQQGTNIVIMSYILLPFQGFFNMIVFLAPKCAKYQKDHPGTWFVMAYLYILADTCSVPFRRCWDRICRSQQMEAILQRRRSSRVQNPFRMSSHFSWRGTLPGETEVVTEVIDPFDDDGIGFNDFNAVPSTSATNTSEASQQQLRDGRSLVSVQEELDEKKDDPRSSRQEIIEDSRDHRPAKAVDLCEEESTTKQQDMDLEKTVKIQDMSTSGQQGPTDTTTASAVDDDEKKLDVGNEDPIQEENDMDEADDP